jgi:hypothetical protein
MKISPAQRPKIPGPGVNLRARVNPMKSSLRFAAFVESGVTRAFGAQRLIVRIECQIRQTTHPNLAIEEIRFVCSYALYRYTDINERPCVHILANIPFALHGVWNLGEMRGSTTRAAAARANGLDVGWGELICSRPGTSS